MALTRAMLKGMGLTEEQVSAIIDEHTTVTSALKEQVKEYKEDAEKLPTVEKELSDLKSDVKKNNWQKKYEDEHKAFEDYKTDVAEKETKQKIKSAYKNLLTECKVGDSHINSILRVTDFSEMKLKEDGSIEGAEDLKKSIESDWSGFISTEETKKTEEPNDPPSKNGEEGEKTGRAAKLAAEYHDKMYGKVKED